MLKTYVVSLTLLALLCSAPQPGFAQKKDKAEKKAAIAAQAKQAEPVFWTDPGDIRSKDLFYGPGGKQGVPKEPFEYVEEDRGGTTPKFEVKDASGEKWKGKLGVESQPETVASRIMWALGFASNIDYLFSQATVPGAAAHQKRGHELIGPGDIVHNVRFQKRPDGWKKAADWSWGERRFRGRRDFNGLRVMMAVLNNWDLKDDNNMILEEKGHPEHVLYGVTDLGASFGKAGHGYNGNESKNNLRAYEKHKFIGKVTDRYVDFNFPAAPNFVHFILFEYPLYFGQWKIHWVGRHIPIEDVRWAAGLLGQLTPEQIRDAFRAANYTPEDRERFARALEKRIAELKKI